MEAVKVAVVQESPVLFDAEKTVDKIAEICTDLKDSKPELVLFPEAFVPGYPRGLSFGATVGSRTEEGKELWLHYWNNSVELHDRHFMRLSACAKDLGAFMAVGVTEKDSISGSLYCTLLYFAADGTYLGKHRKLKPTGTERVIWGEGGGDTLVTINTGRYVTGGLICWENYMPLARTAMYNKGIQIYLAPTADCRDNWQYSMRHIAVEGRCFVLTSNQLLVKETYPDFLREYVKDQPETLCSGGSAIYAPTGEILAGPLYNKTGVLLAELDLSMNIKGKYEFAVSGHYARHDVFKLTVNDQPDTLSR
jgi:nitrilase